MLLSNFQRAIFKKLKASDLTCEVYDLVPEKTILPYVVIGEDEISEYNTKVSTGKEITTKIYIFSEASTSIECKEIFDAVLKALSMDLTETQEFLFHKLEPSQVYKNVEIGLIQGELNLTYRLIEE